MIISTVAEEAFDKMQQPFMIQVIERLGMEGECLNIMRAVYDKPMTSITSQGYLSTFSTSNQVLTKAMKQDRQLKGIQKSGKVFLFLDSMILYIRDLKDSQETLAADDHLSKWQDTNLTQEPVAFL